MSVERAGNGQTRRLYDTFRGVNVCSAVTQDHFKGQGTNSSFANEQEAREKEKVVHTEMCVVVVDRVVAVTRLSVTLHNVLREQFTKKRLGTDE